MKQMHPLIAVALAIALLASSPRCPAQAPDEPPGDREAALQRTGMDQR